MRKLQLDKVHHDIPQEEPEKIQGCNYEQAQIEQKIRELQDIQREDDNDDIYENQSIGGNLLTYLGNYASYSSINDNVALLRLRLRPHVLPCQPNNERIALPKAKPRQAINPVVEQLQVKLNPILETDGAITDNISIPELSQNVDIISQLSLSNDESFTYPI